MTTAQNYFEENNYVVIKEFLTAEMAEIFYQYTKTVTQAVDYKIQVDKPHYNESWDGGFGDGQVPDTFYRYGDPLIDTLMIMSLKR